MYRSLDFDQSSLIGEGVSEVRESESRGVVWVFVLYQSKAKEQKTRSLVVNRGLLSGNELVADGQSNDAAEDKEDNAEDENNTGGQHFCIRVLERLLDWWS